TLKASFFGEQIRRRPFMLLRKQIPKLQSNSSKILKMGVGHHSAGTKQKQKFDNECRPSATLTPKK
ncbi:hypothetical protein E1A91_D09G160700v1, partial [Gossypium mustelinum]